MAQKEYKAVAYKEGLFGSFLHGGELDTKHFTHFLNRHAKNGWHVAAMERDVRHTFFFFKQEAHVVIFERDTK